jgi:hypothetical protein
MSFLNTLPALADGGDQGHDLVDHAGIEVKSGLVKTGYAMLIETTEVLDHFSAIVEIECAVESIEYVGALIKTGGLGFVALGFDVSPGASQFLKQAIEENQDQLHRRSLRSLGIEIDVVIIPVRVVIQGGFS